MLQLLRKSRDWLGGARLLVGRSDTANWLSTVSIVDCIVWSVYLQVCRSIEDTRIYQRNG